ncbi:MAG TPA: RNA polymerase sigma-70 factor [Nocardioidaceae bacterium]|nr:RNA polymerase sigma-70 factor [Nocardioidaceae bacterium]
MTDLAAAYDDLRPLMFSVAYRMLGSVAEAEDVVQEAFLRMHTSLAGGGEPRSPEAFATTVTTRLAIDTLRSARKRREQYVGSWLPEPLLEPATGDPAWRVEMDETVTLAFLVLLEQLSPVERAVFVLREAMGYEYADIAEVVGKSEANCRQLYSRARRRVEADRPTAATPSEQQRAVATQFLEALRAADVDRLERMLAHDVVFYGDGGGKVAAVQKPVAGSVRVGRFLAGLHRRAARFGVRYEETTANGQPAVLVRTTQGAVLGVLTIDVADGKVVALRNQVNPDKLSHLGPVGDLNAMTGATGTAAGD